MEYDDLISDLLEIVQNSKYAGFCLRDIHNTLDKYLEEHNLTLSELGDIFHYISLLISEEMDYELENWTEENIDEEE